LGVKVLLICLGEAVRQGLLAVNPAVRVKLLKSNAESKRRAFTLAEIKRILKACSDETEWRGLVLFGLYLGQRLGDLGERDFVPQLATQCGDDAESSGRLGLYGPRDCGARKRGSLSSVHAPHNRRQARSDATVASCDRQLIATGVLLRICWVYGCFSSQSF
jgi:hypothetical protein